MQLLLLAGSGRWANIGIDDRKADVASTSATTWLLGSAHPVLTRAFARGSDTILRVCSQPDTVPFQPWYSVPQIETGLRTLPPPKPRLEP